MRCGGWGLLKPFGTTWQGAQGEPGQQTDSAQHTGDQEVCKGVILAQVRGRRYEGRDTDPSQGGQVVGKVGWEIENKAEGSIEDDSGRQARMCTARFSPHPGTARDSGVLGAMKRSAE